MIFPPSFPAFQLYYPGGGYDEKNFSRPLFAGALGPKKRHFSQAEAHSTKEIGTMLQHFNIGACLQNLSVS